jgi:HJR/Mrr/RecB family endonuclease
MGRLEREREHVMDQSVDAQAAELNERIAELKRLAEQTELDRRARSQRLTKLSLLEPYLRSAIWLRTAGSDYEYWYVGLLAVLPLATACAAFLLVILLGGRLSWGLILALAVFLLAVAVTAHMLYRGRTDELIEWLAAVRTDRAQTRQQLSAARSAKSAALAQLQDLVARRSELIASNKFQREQLLKRNWQRMRGAEWQTYLSEVLAALGASVETARRSSNAEPDMIANFGGRRIAIQGRGQDHTINNVTVQQAVESMAHYRCHGCAVITNKRFTASARELAKHHGCQLVGEHNFASWVRGQWQL